MGIANSGEEVELNRTLNKIRRQAMEEGGELLPEDLQAMKKEEEEKENRSRNLLSKTQAFLR